jgi:transposase-like protein
MVRVRVKSKGQLAPQKVKTPGSGGRPRKKKVRGRPVHYRRKYSEENLLQAVKEVRDYRMSLGEAAKEFQVPKTTLYDRVNERVNAKSGRPTVLTELEEESLVGRLLIQGEWGFPLSRRDLCNVVKSYLDSLGRKSRKEPL